MPDQRYFPVCPSGGRITGVESGSKPVAQKKAMPGKEKKPSIHERLEINKRIIQEKQGKDKPERGADLGVRTV